MNIYDFADYKEIVRHQIKENKNIKGYRSRLAMHIGCQKSFFSQVLRTHVHFTPDHVASLCEEWGLNEQESDYFLTLLHYARAGSPSLKRYLKKKLAQFRENRGQPSKRILWPELGAESAALQYYSSWIWSAVHILVSNPEMTSSDRIAQQLNLPKNLVEEVLSWLEQKKMIQKNFKGWTVLSTQLHLNANSPMHETHQSNWLQRALFDLQGRNANSLHYSSVFTVDEETFQSLKRSLVDHIEKMNQKIIPAPAEQLVCLSTHLFRVDSKL
jgi:uncharacterized protein (TIGR02147 family)